MKKIVVIALMLLLGAVLLTAQASSGARLDGRVIPKPGSASLTSAASSPAINNYGGLGGGL